MARFSETRIGEMIRGAKAFRIVEFPMFGSDDEAPPVDVAVRCLSESEIDESRIEAQRRLRDWAKRRSWDPVKTTDVDPQMLQRLFERTIVLRAFYDPTTIEDAKPIQFFKSLREVDQLTAPTLTALMGIYLEHQDWVNPFRSLTVEEARELVDALGKRPDLAEHLGKYERDALVNLSITLVSVLRSS